MSKTLSVKVKRSVLIGALQKALDERAKRFAENEKVEADYKKAKEKWEADFIKAVVTAVKNGKGKPVHANETHYYRGNVAKDKTMVELTIEVAKTLLAKEPQCPDLYREYEWRHDKEALEGAIRVLEMAEQELVSTSTYQSVVKYL